MRGKKESTTTYDCVNRDKEGNNVIKQVIIPRKRIHEINLSFPQLNKKIIQTKKSIEQQKKPKSSAKVIINKKKNQPKTIKNDSLRLQIFMLSMNKNFIDLHVLGFIN